MCKQCTLPLPQILLLLFMCRPTSSSLFIYSYWFRFRVSQNIRCYGPGPRQNHHLLVNLQLSHTHTPNTFKSTTPIGAHGLQVYFISILRSILLSLSRNVCTSVRIQIENHWVIWFTRTDSYTAHQQVSTDGKRLRTAYRVFRWTIILIVLYWPWHYALLNVSQ